MKDEFPRTEEGRRANLAVGTTEQRHRGGKAQDTLGKEPVNLNQEQEAWQLEIRLERQLGYDGG